MDEDKQITGKDIRRILERFSSPQTQFYDQEKNSLDIVRLLDGEEASEQLKEIFRKEDGFFEITNQILADKDSQNRVEDRSLTTQATLLYHLIANAGIERLMRNYEFENDTSNLTPDQRLDLKAELARRYVERKTKEREEYDPAVPNPITVGLELEYDSDFVPLSNHLTNTYTQLYYYLSSRHVNLQVQNPEDLVLPNDPNVPVDLDSFDKFKALATIVRKVPIPAYFAIHINRHIRNTTGTPKTLAKLVEPPMKEHDEVEGKEIVTQPTFSFRTQLREILVAAEKGELGNEWNIHATLTGVELSPNDTQFMDILVMAAAAGFIPQHIFDKAIEEQENTPLRTSGIETSWQQLAVEDYHIKFSNFPDEQNYYYFPFHKHRSAVGESYPDYQLRSGVEIRSLLKYEEGEFHLLVRYLDFTEIAAWAVRAEQIPQDERTPNEKKLSLLWHKLNKEFKRLYNSRDIILANKSEYFDTRTEFEPNFEFDQAQGYIDMLSNIILQSTYMDADFQMEAREIITNFKIRAKPLIPTRRKR